MAGGALAAEGFDSGVGSVAMIVPGKRSGSGGSGLLAADPRRQAALRPGGSRSKRLRLTASSV